MKKMLGVLTAFSLTAITTTSVVACGNGQSKTNLKTLLTKTYIGGIPYISADEILKKVVEWNNNLDIENLKITNIIDVAADITANSDNLAGTVRVYFTNNAKLPEKLGINKNLGFEKTGVVKAFSPDGNYIGTINGLFDLSTGEVVPGLGLETTGEITSFSNDGKYIGTVDKGVFDLSTKKVVEGLSFDITGKIWSFSPNGKYVGTDNGVFSLVTKEVISDLGSDIPSIINGKVPSYSFSPNSNRVATSWGVFDLNDRKNPVIGTGTGQIGNIYSFSPNEKYIYSSSGILELSTKEIVDGADVNTDELLLESPFSFDSRYVATNKGIFDFSTSNISETLNFEITGKVYSFSNDGKYVATDNGIIQIRN